MLEKFNVMMFNVEICVGIIVSLCCMHMLTNLAKMKNDCDKKQIFL